MRRKPTSPYTTASIARSAATGDWKIAAEMPQIRTSDNTTPMRAVRNVFPVFVMT
jgi:hypothetical protein